METRPTIEDGIRTIRRMETRPSIEDGVRTMRRKRGFMVSYEDRLISFADFPKKHSISIYECSSTGFYYTKHSDVVECYECSLTVDNWNPFMKPAVIHAGRAPRCPHVLHSYTDEQIEQCKELVRIDTTMKFDRNLAKKNDLGYQFHFLNPEPEAKNSPSEDLTCVICLVRPREYTVVPCGHFIVCGQCKSTLQNISNANNRICPKCRGRFKSFLKTYL